MSNNDLFCAQCNSQHHPADTCPMEDSISLLVTEAKKLGRVEGMKEMDHRWRRRFFTQDNFTIGFNLGIEEAALIAEACGNHELGVKIAKEIRHLSKVTYPTH